MKTTPKTQKPTVDLAERIIEAKSVRHLHSVAAALEIPAQKFLATLASMGAIYKQDASWLPSAKHQKAGRFITTAHKTKGFAFVQTRFTPKGVAWIAKKLSSIE